MVPTASLLTTETEVGRAFSQELSLRGFAVQSGTDGDTKGSIDLLLVNPVAGEVEPNDSETDFAELRRIYDTQALGALRFVEKSLPRMQEGRKRLCFVIDTGEGLGSEMAAGALHMAYKILFNDLRRDGYTFRLFTRQTTDSAWIKAACDHFLTEQVDENHFAGVGLE